MSLYGVKKKSPKQNNKRGKSYRDEAGIKRFGARVVEIRKVKKITQEELVRRTGFELRQIGRIERGEISTSISHAFKLAEALEVPDTELFSTRPFKLPKKKNKPIKGS